MNAFGKKMLVALTALGLVLSFSVDVALGSTHHNKQKPAKKHHNEERLNDELKFFELGGPQAELAAFESKLESEGGMPAPGSAAANELMKLQNAVLNVNQTITSLENKTATVTLSQWDNLNSKVNSNSAAISTLTTTVSDDVGHLQDQITANDKSITDNTNSIKANADKIISLSSQEAQDKMALQKEIDANTARISETQKIINDDIGKLGNTKDEIRKLEKEVALNIGDIAANKSKINDLERYSSQLQSEIDRNKADIASANKKITENREAILLVTVMSVKNAEDIQKNADNIVRNAENIEKNSKAIGINHKLIEENVKKIKEVAQQVKTNADFIAKNAKTGERNAKSVKEAEERIKANMKLLTTFHGDLVKVAGLAHSNAMNIHANLSLIHKNLGLINDNAKAIQTADVNIDANANNIHQLGLAVQNNANQIVRTANNELRDMKVTKALADTVKQNVEGIDINTQLAKMLDQQSLIDEGALQKMNAEIFQNAEALGNTTAVSEDGDSLIVGAKNLANLSQFLAAAQHHNMQAKKSVDNNIQEAGARLQALHVALSKAKTVSANDAALSNSLSKPLQNAQQAEQASKKLSAAIDKQRTRLHMQGKTDKEVINQTRIEASKIAKQKAQLVKEKKRLQHAIAKAKTRLASANKYKAAANENAKRAHKLAVEHYFDTVRDKQPHDARALLRIQQEQKIMENE